MKKYNNAFNADPRERAIFEINLKNLATLKVDSPLAGGLTLRYA